MNDLIPSADATADGVIDLMCDALEKHGEGAIGLPLSVYVANDGDITDLIHRIRARRGNLRVCNLFTALKNVMMEGSPHALEQLAQQQHNFPEHEWRIPEIKFCPSCGSQNLAPRSDDWEDKARDEGRAFGECSDCGTHFTVSLVG